MTKTVRIFRTYQRAGAGVSPVSVGNYRISLPSPGTEMQRQSKYRRISSVTGNHMNRFPGRGEAYA